MPPVYQIYLCRPFVLTRIWWFCLFSRSMGNEPQSGYSLFKHFDIYLTPLLAELTQGLAFAVTVEKEHLRSEKSDPFAIHRWNSHDLSYGARSLLGKPSWTNRIIITRYTVLFCTQSITAVLAVPGTRFVLKVAYR